MAILMDYVDDRLQAIRSGPGYDCCKHHLYDELLDFKLLLETMTAFELGEDHAHA